MLRIPSPVLDKKTCQVHELGLRKKRKKRKKKSPMYPVQYLCSKTTTRVLGPGPTTKLVGTMAQDSVQKKERKTMYKRKKKRKRKQKDPHAIKKLEAVLKHKHLEAVSKT